MKDLRRVKQNNLLLKFLVLATIFFIVLVGILFWQQRKVTIIPITDEQTIVHFSDKVESPSVTEAYVYGAKYIHDIEAYPEIKNLFFTATFPQLTDKNKITEALAEIKAENVMQDEFGKTHVYSTSYYIGNLLILPDLTLYATLVDDKKHNTSILLDTALADLRSGVAKIQNFYDVAPPAYYDNKYAGASYFSTASFPSLTVAETGIVLYLLAEIDPINARLYEQSLHQYANQVLASGANFYLDIEYALYLASAYFSIMKENPDYKNLLQLAKEEWKGTKKFSLVNYSEIKFPLNNFPYENHFAIIKPKINTYKSLNVNEKLSGILTLSLVDNRLPDSVGKLYHYNLTDKTLLPFAVDLQGRKFASLGKVVANFAGAGQDKYFFVSGDRPRASEARTNFFAESQILYREGNSVIPLNGQSDQVQKKIQKNLELSPGQDRLLYNQFTLAQKSNSDSWDIKLDKLTQGKLLKGEVIARGASPVMALADESVLFWREGSVWQVNTNSGFEQKVIALAERNGMYEKTNLDYLEGNKTLVVSRSYLEPEILEPKTELSIHKIEKSGEENLVTKKVYEIEIKDATVLSVKQSPGGNYLAVLVNETMGERKPSLLIFDINNGIIKIELDLKPYSNKAMTIDEWLPTE